ncbi:MAG: pre-peptidase C-terminal domain-containing protein [Akkermansiaceae bacterium]|nr:pre-peptidase C-terminal domain-containing protein [Armatimonadota bacterium]
MKRYLSVFLILSSGIAATAHAQDVPRLSGVFPAGVQAGQSVEVTVRGSALLGAKKIWFSGPGGVMEDGLTGEIAGGSVTVDAAAKPLHQAKCANCHELRSPANRSLSPEQWAQTVERMVKQHAAPLSPDESAKVIAYLQALTRAGELKVKVAVPKDAVPGKRELRVVTANGVTTAAVFEVGALPEVVSEGAKTSREAPQKIVLPVVVNGTIKDSGQRDWFAFVARKGEPVTISLQAYRLNQVSPTFFNPALYLYDGSGKLISKSVGYDNVLFGNDPAMELVAPADGTYTVLVRDLLYHANPLSHYRLAVGTGLPVDARFVGGVITRPGDTVTPNLAASMPLPAGMTRATIAVPVTASWGIFSARTPAGDLPVVIGNAPDGGAPITGDPATAPATPLPAAFRGAITKTGSATDVTARNIFKVKTTRANVSVYFTSLSLGSRLRPTFIVTRPTGEYVTGHYADRPMNFRLENAFREPGEYIVHVFDGDGKGGGDFGYVWEAYDTAPEFALTATPDAVNLLPGGTAAVTVEAKRRENITGPITVSVRDLPPGVTTLPCTIPPDHDRATLVFRAEPTAAINANPVIVEGTYAGADGKPTVRRALPVDFYRAPNNDYRPIERGLQSVAVIDSEPSPAVSVSVEGAEKGLALTIDRETEIKVKITRRDGFKGDLFIIPLNFPPGVSLRGNTYVGGDKSEAALTLYADGNARFLKGERPAKDLPPMVVTFAIRPNGVGDRDYIACTPPISLTAKETIPTK